MNDPINKRSELQPGATSNSAIVVNTRNHVLQLFNAKHDARLVYHTWQRTCAVVECVQQIAEAEGIVAEAREVAIISAWFHLTGYLVNYDRTLDNSKELATTFLQGSSYPVALIERVIGSIDAVAQTEIPALFEAQVLLDAIRSVNFGANFLEDRPVLRLEWELVYNRRLSTLEWNQIQLQDLLGTKFYTGFAKQAFQPTIAQHLLIQKGKVEKNKRNGLPLNVLDDQDIRKFEGLEKKIPGSAMQTFFRTNYRNHINLSAIADNKANIMISVNAILISVLISILTYKDITDTTPVILLPFVIFLVTGLTSLIFAVLSIRPKVTSKNAEIASVEEAKKNIVFFGNFIQLDVDQYEEAMDSVLRNGELLYGNMTRDLYYLGKVLDKKYRYLTMSYNIFMVGFIATVATFLFALFT